MSLEKDILVATGLVVGIPLGLMAKEALVEVLTSGVYRSFVDGVKVWAELYATIDIRDYFKDDKYVNAKYNNIVTRTYGE